MLLSAQGHSVIPGGIQDPDPSCLALEPMRGTYALWSPGLWWREGINRLGVGTCEAGLGPRCLVPGGGA